MKTLGFILGIPLGVIVGGLLGRFVQRRMWELHLPYEERVRRLKGER